MKGEKRRVEDGGRPSSAIDGWMDERRFCPSLALLVYKEAATFSSWDFFPPLYSFCTVPFLESSLIARRFPENSPTITSEVFFFVRLR